jgi:hypothetical protein
VGTRHMVNSYYFETDVGYIHAICADLLEADTTIYQKFSNPYDGVWGQILMF